MTEIRKSILAHSCLEYKLSSIPVFGESVFIFPNVQWSTGRSLVSMRILHLLSFIPVVTLLKSGDKLRFVQQCSCLFSNRELIHSWTFCSSDYSVQTSKKKDLKCFIRWHLFLILTVLFAAKCVLKIERKYAAIQSYKNSLGFSMPNQSSSRNVTSPYFTRQ
jgi:hypothetical protein